MIFLQFSKKNHHTKREYSITTQPALFLVSIILGQRLLKSVVSAQFSVLQSFYVWFACHFPLIFYSYHTSANHLWNNSCRHSAVCNYIKGYPSRNSHREKKSGNLSSIRLKTRCSYYVVTKCYLQMHVSSVQWNGCSCIWTVHFLK